MGTSVDVRGRLEEDEVEAALEWPRVGEGVLAARFFGWLGAEGGALGGLVELN